MNILFLDTETMMLPRLPNGKVDNDKFKFDAPYTDCENWPRLLEIAIIRSNRKGQFYGDWSDLVKPIDFTIGKRGKGFDNITQERSAVYGKPIIHILRHIMNSIEDADLIVAYNTKFDAKILNAEFHQTFSEIPDWPDWLDAKKVALDFGYESTKHKYGMSLVDLAAHLKIPYEGAHGAMADTIVLKNCFFKMLELKYGAGKEQDFWDSEYFTNFLEVYR